MNQIKYLKKIGHFFLIEMIAEKPTSILYLSIDDENDNLYLAKCIPKIYLDKENGEANLKNEVLNLSKFSHKNIISLKAIGKTKNNIYLMTEYCNGGTLNDFQKYYIKKNKVQLNELFIQKAVSQIVSGLEFMHKNQIIHKDIKLGNILINFNKYQNIAIKGKLPPKVNYSDISLNDLFTLKISDLDYSKHYKNFNSSSTILGPPETISADASNNSNGNTLEKIYNNKTDLWSLGEITYELLTGQPPFFGDNSKDICKKILEGKYKLPSSLIASVEIITFINGLLQYDPQKRLDWEGIKRHEFLNKNVQDFTYIKLNSIKENDKDEIEMNSKNNANLLWILFKSKNSSFTFDQINFINMNKKEKEELAQRINESKIDNGQIEKALKEEKIKIKEEKKRLIEEKSKIEKLIKEAESMKIETSMIKEKNDKEREKLNLEEQKLNKLKEKLKKDKLNKENDQKIKEQLNEHQSRIKEVEKSKIENDINIKNNEKLLKNAEKIKNEIDIQMNAISQQSEKNNDSKDFDDWVIYNDEKEKSKTNENYDKKPEKDLLEDFEIIDTCEENENDEIILSQKLEA